MTTESEDPVGEAVTYRYAWFVDDAPSVTDPTVPHDLTAKHQTWRVEVTPVAGTREGTAATASVEVQNTPPEVITAGLSTYEPLADETVRAFPNGASDPDGDTITFRFEWVRNDETIADVTGDTLDLESTGFAEGDELELTVSAHDGEETGPGFSLGPFGALPPVTQWRQIRPDTYEIFPVIGFSYFSGEGLFIHDPRHRRLVLQEDAGSLWELSLEPGRNRWVKLPPAGEHPVLWLPTTVYDPVGQRAIVFGGYDHLAMADNEAVYALDLTRSDEQWFEIRVRGDRPPAFFDSSAFFDEPRNRVLVYGTHPRGGRSPHRELWELDLTPGAERWQRIELTATPTASAGGAWLYVPEHDRAYHVAGSVWDAATEELTGASDEVWALTLTRGDESFALLEPRVPGDSPMEAAAAWAAHERRGAGVLFGVADGPWSTSTGVWKVNPDTMVWEHVSTENAPPFPGGYLRASYDSQQERVLLLSSVFLKEAVSFDPDGDTYEPIIQHGVDHPAPAGRPSIFRGLNGFYVSGWNVPWSSTGAYASDPFFFDFGMDRFELIEPAEDPTHGALPPVRGAGSPHGSPSVVLFGGEVRDGVLGPAQAWQIDTAEPTQWVRLTWDASSSSPQARTGAVTWNGDWCGPLVIFGGWDPETGTATNDHWTLHGCASDGTGCTWEEASSTVLRPSHGAFAAHAVVSRDVIVFGGGDGTGSTTEVWSVPTCSPGLETPDYDWMQLSPELSPDGGAPSARLGHSMTTVHSSSTTDDLIVFGGVFDLPFEAPKNDAWFLRRSSSGWQWHYIEVPAGTAVPAPRAFHAAAWDDARHRLFVFGGTRLVDDHPVDSNDLWVLMVQE